MPKHPVVHFEIGCRDLAATKEFYQKMFDWPIDEHFQISDAGLPGRTVSTLFSSITPRSAHGDRSPVLGGGNPRSLPYSAKILSRLRGSGRTSGATEKLNPTA